MRGVERVQNDDLSGSGAGGGEKVIQTLRGAEQMAGGARIHEQVLIGGRSQSTAHGGQAADELRDGQFELADQHTARRRDGKAEAVRAGRQRQGEVGDQQRFTPNGQKTRRGPSPPEQSRFLFLINVSVSAAFN